MAQCVEELTITPQDLKQAEFVGLDRDGQLVGIGALVVDKPNGQGEIRTMFVDANHGGTGIGLTIMQELLRKAGRHELEMLHLSSEPLSADFYAGFGFVVVGKERSGSIAGRFLPKMELRLGSVTSP